MVTVLLITVKLVSPFLHIDEPHSESAYTVIHCAACEYEATQAIEPELAVVLPILQFSYEKVSCPASENVNGSTILTSDYRGPPQNS